MNDALLVSGRESLRDLQRVVENLPLRNGAGVEPLAQRLALLKLHDRVDGAVLRSEVVDRENVGIESAATAFAFRSDSASVSGVRGACRQSVSSG